MVTQTNNYHSWMLLKIPQIFRKTHLGMHFKTTKTSYLQLSCDAIADLEYRKFYYHREHTRMPINGQYSLKWKKLDIPPDGKPAAQINQPD